MDEIGGIFTQWQDLLQSTNTAETDEFEFMTKELTEHVNRVQGDLGALEETVSIVERHQQKFNLDDADVGERKQFIRDVRRKVKEIRSKIDSPQTQAKIDRDKRAVLMSGNRHLAPHLQQAAGLRGDLMIADEREDQQLLFQQQDEVMDEIYSGAQDLHQISVDMGQEINSQTSMLEEVNQHTGDLSTRLKAANNKVASLIENSLSTKQKCCTMLFLALTFLILTFFVVYT